MRPCHLSVGGHTLTILNVPAFSCPRCDNILYKASTVKTMDALIRENPAQNTLQYPCHHLYDAEILTRLGAVDPFFEQDLDEPIRRYDLACLESRLLKSLTPVTR